MRLRVRPGPRTSARTQRQEPDRGLPDARAHPCRLPVPVVALHDDGGNAIELMELRVGSGDAKHAGG